MAMKSLLFGLLLFLASTLAAGEAKEMMLTSVDVGKIKVGWGEAKINASISGQRVMVAGKLYGNALGVHTEGHLAFSLDGQADRFHCLVGIDDAAQGQGSAELIVYGDGFKVLGRSGKLLPGQPARDFRVKLAGQKNLILQFSDAGDGNSFDHLDIIGPSISYEGEKPVVLDLLPADRTPYILTPPAPSSPRLNPPRIVGVRPGSPFLFRIPASGKAPLQFAAGGLPPGLSLDPATGVISGKITRLEKKTWTVKITAKNLLGSDASALRIVVGDRIALTPPMGWNSWYVWSESVNEKHLRQAADAFVRSGLADYGWSYLNLDDCWQGERTGPDKALAANEKFPDIKGAVDHVHSLGLKAGIYSTPWIGSYAGFRGGSCTNPEGNYEGLAADKRLQPGQIFGRYPGHQKFKAAGTGQNWFFDADMRQISGWGFDFIKVDWNPNDLSTTERISRDVRSQSRDIVLSLSNAATLANATGYAQLADLWRTTGDIQDTWASIARIGFGQQPWIPFAGPGHWNDPDMLQIGFTNTPNQLVANSRPSRLTPNEQYSQITLWSLLAAPLILSCDLEKLDPFTLNLLTNPEVIAVNQDPLGKAAIELCATNHLRVLCKTLEDGALAFGLFNTDGDFPFQADLDLSTLQLPRTARIRDLWRQKDLAPSKGHLAIDIPPHGCLLLRAAGKTALPTVCQATGCVLKMDGGWTARFNEKLAEARQGGIDIVWIGDSITHGWDNPENQHILRQYFGQWESLNLGISGDRTENVLWRLHNGALDDLHPKVAVLMIGTNNTDGEHFPKADTAEELSAGQLAILNLLRSKLPNTEILFLKVFPYGKEDNPRRQANFKASELTAAKIAGDRRIRYLDLTKTFMPDGKTLANTNMPDFLHPNSFGYWQWADAIAPAIYNAIDYQFTYMLPAWRQGIPWWQVKVAGAASAENSGGWRAPYHPASLANDGDPRTFWHTQFTPAAATGPQWLALDLGSDRSVGGVTVLPRPEAGPGIILRARIYVSETLEKRGAPLFDGCLPPALPGQPQAIGFPTKTGRFVTIEPLAGATSQAGFAIAEFTVLTTKPILTLETLRENQVFQRGPDNAAKIRFAGTVPPGATQIILTLSGKPHPAAGPLPAPATFPVDPKNGTFAGELRIPAGGWYRAELRAMKPGWLGAKCLDTVVIEKFGVGEVFVTAGQSNSTCCGDTRTPSASGLVAAFSGRHWVPANDPLPGSADQRVYRGGSFWPSFGDAIAKRFGVPVGIAMTGYGGSSTAQWQPEASTGYFAGMAERLRQLGPNGCRCLLWHQGESDTNNKSPDAQQGYYNRLKKIIDASREKAGWPVPWSVARASFRPNAGNDTPVRDAQKQLWDDAIAIPGPDTDQYLGDLRDNGGNGIHFSPKGLAIVGQAWADLVSPLIEAAAAKK